MNYFNNSVPARNVRFKTERAFHAAMKRYGTRVVEWWGEDHAWVIRIAKENP